MKQRMMIMKSIGNIHHRLCATAAICLIASASYARQQYTLDECVELALQNNVRMKNAGNDMDAAAHQKKSAFTNYFPSVSAAGGGFMADKGLLQLEMMPGTELSLMKNGIVGGISATMPLFAGGQIVHGNKLARINEEKYRLLYEQTENEVRLAAEQYFWQVVTLKEKLRTIDILQEQTDRIHQDVAAAVQSGVTNRNDLLQVELRKNEIDSKRISVANALNVSCRLLAQYIGCPSDSVDTAWDIDWGVPSPPDSLYRSPETSLGLTTEYNLLNKNVDSNKLQYKMEMGKNLPAVAAGGGYMYDNLLDHDHPFWICGITVNIPLTQWWGGSHDMKRKKLQVRNAENMLKDQSELLVIRMFNTWNAVTDAYKQVEIAVESINQAGENLRLQSDYYDAGMCTMSELLEAQSLYQQSRDKYVESYAMYEVKKREYLQATGR